MIADDSGGNNKNTNFKKCNSLSPPKSPSRRTSSVNDLVAVEDHEWNNIESTEENGKLLLFKQYFPTHYVQLMN